MTPAAERDIELGPMSSPIADDELELPISPPRTRNQSACGRMCGRVVKDWTQVVGGFLTIAGLCGGGVGFAMEDYRVILGAAGAILASSVLMCGRISCLKPEKELERQVAHFSSEVDRLTRNEQKLKAHKVELQGVLAEAQNSIKALGQTLKVPVDRIEGVTDRLEAIELKLHVLVDLYYRYKAATQAFSKDLKAFKQNHKVTKESISRLGKATKNLSLAEGELSEEVDEYQEAGAFHRQQNTELRRILSEFKADFVEMQKRFLIMRNELEELRQHVLKLDEADDKFRSGGADFKEGVDLARAELIPKLHETMSRLDKALDELAEDSEKSAALNSDSEEDDPSGEVELHSVVVHSSSGQAASSSDVGGRDVIDVEPADTKSNGKL